MNGEEHAGHWHAPVASTSAASPRAMWSDIENPLAGTVMPPAIAPVSENATDFLNFHRDSQRRINLAKTSQIG